jgi:hypothetical protein
MKKNGVFSRPTSPVGLTRPQPTAIGTFATVRDFPQGYVPPRLGRRGGLGVTPALHGLFRTGNRTVGISQINAMATNIPRGS